MKVRKVISIAATAALVLTAAGCGASDSSKTANAQEQAAAVESTTEEAEEEAAAEEEQEAAETEAAEEPTAEEATEEAAAEEEPKAAELSAEELESRKEEMRAFFNPVMEIDYYPADYDNDGEIEIYAAYAESYNEAMGLYDKVTIAYNDPESGNSTFEDFKDEGNTIGYPTGIVTSAGHSFFVWEWSAGGSGSASYVLSGKDGKPYAESISGGMGIQQYDENTISVIDSQFDANFDGTGHTYNTYYLYWDNGFKEYGGVEVTEDQFRKLENADAVLSDIEAAGGELQNIYYRGNDIININFKNNSEETNRNMTLVVENGKILYLGQGGDPDSESMYDYSIGYGIYKTAMYSDIAVYNDYPY